MAKKSKTYRGQRAYREASKSPCGCFFCTGHSKEDLQHKREKEADNEIISNVFLYDVSNNEVAVCDHEWTRPIINANNYQCCKCGVWKQQTERWPYGGVPD